MKLSFRLILLKKITRQVIMEKASENSADAIFLRNSASPKGHICNYFAIKHYSGIQ